MRSTSITSYNNIKASGALSKMRWNVYDTLFHNGPMTAGEVYHQLNSQKTANANMHARLRELVQMGVVTEVGTKVCNITQQTVILWDVTPNMPIKLVRQETNKQKIARLEAEVLELKALLAAA